MIALQSLFAFLFFGSVVAQELRDDIRVQYPTNITLGQVAGIHLDIANTTFTNRLWFARSFWTGPNGETTVDHFDNNIRMGEGSLFAWDWEREDFENPDAVPPVKDHIKYMCVWPEPNIKPKRPEDKPESRDWFPPNLSGDWSVGVTIVFFYGRDGYYYDEEMGVCTNPPFTAEAIKIPPGVFNVAENPAQGTTTLVSYDPATWSRPGIQTSLLTDVELIPPSPTGSAYTPPTFAAETTTTAMATTPASSAKSIRRSLGLLGVSLLSSLILIF